ncbi:hypothetical protein H1R20_g617, partial [Candolleomyces eurysporus]
MGLTFADLQNLSREATALYPNRHLPVFTDANEEEKKVAELQLGLVSRLKSSQYYVVERSKSTELPRYSDKYRPSLNTQPTLKRKELHAPFFPTELFEDYFNPKRMKKAAAKSANAKINLDDLMNEGDEEEKSADERSEVGSQEAEDYDVDEEYDNDYAENYFDNGEGDDFDDLGGGGGDEGGGDYD